MSGDGAGIIIGAAVALPLVAVAGAGLVAYGAAKALYYCGKGCVNAYKKHKEITQIKLESTNREMDVFYKNMQNASADMQKKNEEAFERAERAIQQNAAALNIPQNAITAQNAKNTIANINHWQKQFSNTFINTISTEHKNNLKAFEETSINLEKTLKEELKTKNAVSNFITNVNEKNEILQNNARNLYNQAVNELENISKADVHNLLSGEISALKNQLSDVARMFNSKSYEAALAGTEDVMCSIAMLASRLNIAEEERWFNLAKVYNKALMLKGRLDATKVLKIRNPATNCDENFSMDLFTRENHGVLSDKIDELLYKLELAMDIRTPAPGETKPVFSQAELDRYNTILNGSFENDVDNTINEGIRRIAEYCEKLNCAKTIVDELKRTSNYKDMWLSYEGEDPTCPLVLHMKDTQTKDEVSIRLFDQADHINIDIFDFTNPNSQINENRRQQFRNLVDNALCTIPGVTAQTDCVNSTYGKNTTRPEFGKPEEISNMSLGTPNSLTNPLTN